MAEEATIQKQEEMFADESFREMMDAGVFYGRKKSKTHPKMKNFILGNRNGIEIINLAKTKEGIEAVQNFLKEKVAAGKNILFVGTQPSADSVTSFAKENNYPFVDNRWLGGTLTNIKVITGRIEYFRKLKADLASGALVTKYTKKERLDMEKELARLQELMGGLENFNGMPDILVVIDSNVHINAIREAKHSRVPVIALINTDSDPDVVDHPVIGNTKARSSISWFMSKIGDAIKEGKKNQPVKETKEAK